MNEAIRRAISSHWREIYDWAGLGVRGLVTATWGHDVRILDVGAGQGKYRVMLADYAHVDGCEIWEPTVEKNNLRELYDVVHVGDIHHIVMSPTFYDGRADQYRYDVVILGDVLEHLTRERAQEVLNVLYAMNAHVIVVVPYNYPQDEEDGNCYQAHLQEDLSPEVMAREYPELQLMAIQSSLDGSPFKGLYQRRTA